MLSLEIGCSAVRARGLCLALIPNEAIEQMFIKYQLSEVTNAVQKAVYVLVRIVLLCRVERRGIQLVQAVQSVARRCG